METVALDTLQRLAVLVTDAPTVTTETSSANLQRISSSQNASSIFSGIQISPDIAFLKTIPAMLMLVEIVLGLLVWSLVASLYHIPPVLVWVIIITLLVWISTILLFLIYFFGVPSQFSSVPWLTLLLVYNIVAAVLYLICAMANAVYTGPFLLLIGYENLASSTCLAILVTVTYSGSAFFAFNAWKSARTDPAMPPVTS
ncbi:CKLF-like MARVEL transmembrane domain-containing protein 8 [Brienomyrus brachyistius]|uniref:CKLF-like MARVEL transmembrane domain-containing protein 8 n=1 Tax=Brienomyrus brachyistius TaxID=42636 RepID=UPI0020B18BB1|nr:CKLF-like MARVEL transmembrane domain-containing protein 8 [Brienomyrus brachyistius]XP_048828631.1 CKLF-like MARVEL transmembrane domain-containing protein 8 [Brienomyrus brachyistius]